MASASAQMRARPVTTSAAARGRCSRASRDLDGADELPADHERRPQRAMRQPRRCSARRPRWSRPRSPTCTATASRPPSGRGRGPTRRGRTRSRAALVELAAVDGDGQPQAGARAHEDVAARRPGEFADAPRGLVRGPRAAPRRAARELESGAQDGAQVLALAAQLREVARAERLRRLSSGRSAMTSAARYRRWPPGLRWAAMRSASVQRRTVFALTPSRRATSRHAQPGTVLSLSSPSHGRSSCIGRMRLKLYQSSHHDTARREVREDGRWWPAAPATGGVVTRGRPAT